MKYPVKFGFNVSVEIIRDNERAKVKVHCPMYLSREFIMSHSYSLEFTDNQILNDSDFIRVMARHFPNN